jgi:MFS family permease
MCILADTQERHLRRNLAALVGDFALFSIGFAFFDPTVVVPAFIKELTGSDLLVGILAAVRTLMVTVPQIVAVSVLLARPHKKPLLAWSSLGGRLPVLILALSALFWARSAPWLVVGVLALAIAFFYISEGLNYISWPDLVGKVVPARIRGRFLGSGQLLSSLGALGSGYLVRLVLGAGGLTFSSRWAVVFGCAFVGMMLSLACILLIREEAGAVSASRVDVWQSLRAMLGYLRTDARLRRVVAIQLVTGIVASVYPFFVVRARDLFAASDAMIGTFLMLQNLGGMVAALLCGYLVDHVGSWFAIRLSTAMQACALVAVILAKLLGVPQPLYLLGFFLLGFSAGSSWWVFSAYLMEVATEEQRPTYLASSGIFTSPTFLSSILIGGLFGVVSPEIVFGGALLLSLGGLALTVRKQGIGGRV